VWSYGSNQYGQLGRTGDELKLMPLKCEGMDLVALIACAPNYSLAYTQETGFLYYWGYLVPEKLKSISYEPSLLTVSSEIKLVQIYATSRKILACDQKQRLLKTDLL